MFPTTVFGTNTLTAFYYYMVDKQSRMKSNNPEMPIDYEKTTLNISKHFHIIHYYKINSFTFNFKSYGTFILI